MRAKPPSLALRINREYDQANRPIAVRGPSSAVSFAYNGLGDRLQHTVNGVTTQYVNDPAAGLTQVLSDGMDTYLCGVGRIAQQGTNLQYFGADGLGNVRQLYNTSGQVIADTRYDPYGQVLNQSGTATSVYGFAGEMTDPTGLTYGLDWRPLKAVPG